MFFLLFIISVPLVLFANPKRNLDNVNGNKVIPEIEHNLNYWREFKEDFKKDGGKNLKKETFNNLEENYYYDDNTHSAKYIIKKKPPHFENEKFVDQQEYDVEPIEALDDNDFVSDDEPKKHILKVREKFVDPELLEIEKNLELNEKSSEEEISEQKESTTSKQVDNNNNIEVSFHEYINKSNVNIVLSKPFTSPTYSNIPITKFFVNVFKFVLRGKEILNYPVNALSDNMKEGHCYSFEGQTGNITIDLKTPLLVRAISIEHPRTTNPSSTPKTFSVFSFSAQSIDQLFLYENHGKYIATNLEFPKGTVGPKIYSFTPIETRFIQFRFLENHGDPHYTCIYRLNVYL